MTDAGFALGFPHDAFIRNDVTEFAGDRVKITLHEIRIQPHSAQWAHFKRLRVA